jgi:plasmid stability protein
MSAVKELLVRIPDDLHARLVARAKRVGRSTTAIVTELLEAGVAGDARADLRARAGRLGVLASAPSPVVDIGTRQSAVEAMGGIGPVVDEILGDGR